MIWTTEEYICYFLTLLFFFYCVYQDKLSSNPINSTTTGNH